MKQKIRTTLHIILVVCLVSSILTTPATAFLWDGNWNDGESDNTDTTGPSATTCEAGYSEDYNGDVSFYPGIRNIRAPFNEIVVTIEPAGTVGADSTTLCEDMGSASTKFQLFMEGEPLTEPRIVGGFDNIDDERILTVPIPENIDQNTEKKFQVITKNHASTFNYDDYQKTKEVDDWKFQEAVRNENWVFPVITDDSGDKVVSSIEYTDLWYEMTTLNEENDQYKILRNQLNATTGSTETAGATFLLGARETIDRGAITQTPKRHTYTWNKQIEHRSIENDVKIYLPEKLITKDNPVIGATGVEFVTIDPHTQYIDSDGSSQFFSTSSTTEYINRKPEVTIAATEGRIEARQTVLEESGTEGNPTDYKVEYSIASKNVDRNLTVLSPGNPEIDPKVYQDAFGRNDVTTQDVNITNVSSNITAGDEIKFDIDYEINATEKIEEYTRTATARTNDKGEFIGYDYGPWILSNTSYKDYQTSKSKTTTKTLYDPKAYVKYNKFERQGKLFLYMNVNTTQPIAGFSPQYYGSTTTDGEPTEVVTMPNMYFSRSVPRFRGTLSQDDILPVTHGTTPSGVKPSLDRKYAEDIDLLATRGEQGTYSDPDDIDMPIESNRVTEVDNVTVYAQYDNANFNKNRITFDSIIPDTDVRVNTTMDKSLGESNASTVTTLVNTQEKQNGKTEVNVKTIRENGSRLPTAKYNHTHIRVSVGGDDHRINTTEPSGTGSIVVDPVPPEMISVKLITDTESAKQADDPIFLGYLVTKQLSYTAISNFEGNVMAIFTSVIQQFLWYFLPAMLLLSVVTKGITGEWIPYID